MIKLKILSDLKRYKVKRWSNSEPRSLYLHSQNLCRIGILTASIGHSHGLHWHFHGLGYTFTSSRLYWHSHGLYKHSLTASMSTITASIRSGTTITISLLSSPVSAPLSALSLSFLCVAGKFCKKRAICWSNWSHYSTVRHVTGNDQDYLRKIPRAVVQISALL